MREEENEKRAYVGQAGVTIGGIAFYYRTPSMTPSRTIVSPFKHG